MCFAQCVVKLSCIFTYKTTCYRDTLIFIYKTTCYRDTLIFTYKTTCYRDTLIFTYKTTCYVDTLIFISMCTYTQLSISAQLIAVCVASNISSPYVLVVARHYQLLSLERSWRMLPIPMLTENPYLNQVSTSVGYYTYLSLNVSLPVLSSSYSVLRCCCILFSSSLRLRLRNPSLRCIPRSSYKSYSPSQH